jgi:hypothetical protein
MRAQVFAIDGNPGKISGFKVMKGIRKRHITKAVVMPVGFPVGCNGYQPGLFLVPGKIVHHPVGKPFAIF